MRIHPKLKATGIILLASLAVLTLLGGCKETFALRPILEGPGALGLALSPSTYILEVSSAPVNYTASGGTPPYTYSILSGAGSIDAITGDFSAPGSPGYTVVRVTDSLGYQATAEADIRSSIAALTISPNTATLSTGATLTFTAIGGVAPYTFTTTTSGSGAGDPVGGGSSADYTAGGSAGTDVITLTDSLLDTVTATVTVQSAPIPDVDYQVSAVVSTGGQKAGQAMTGSFTLDNVGSTDGSDTVNWYAYVSTTNNLSGVVKSLGSGSRAGMTVAEAPAVIPLAGTWPAAASPPSFFVVVDVVTSVDSTPGNNMAASGGYTVSAPNVDYSAAVPEPAILQGDSRLIGEAIPAGSFQITNSGTDAGTSTVFWTAWASTDTAANTPANDYYINSGSIAALGAGATSTPIPIAGNYPPVPGSFYIVVSWSAADDTNAVNDITYGADVNDITLPPPADVDYESATALISGTTVTVGDPISEAVTVTNAGADNGSFDVDWVAWISTDNALNTPANDTPVDLGTIAGGLNAAASTGVTINGTWTTTGTYYLIVEWSAPDEADPADDFVRSVTPVTVDPLPPVDVEYVSSSILPTGGSLFVSDLFSVPFTIDNAGADNGSFDITWTAWASTDTALNTVANDFPIDSGTIAGGINGGAGSTPTINGNWPAVPGNYYVVVTWSALDDQTTADNSIVSAATNTVNAIPPADIDYESVTALPFGGSLVAGAPVSETFDLDNTGLDNGTQTVTWNAWASTDSAPDTFVNDFPIDSGILVGGLAGLGSSSETISGSWPAVPGNYFLVVSWAASDDVDTGNNSIATAGTTTIIPAPPADVDYESSTVLPSGGTVFAGGPVVEIFDIDNTGLDNGSQDITWTAWASTDDLPNTVGNDYPIDSGTISGGINAGGTDTPAINGSWPLLPDDYFLVVVWSAADDLDTGNNIIASATPVTVDPAPGADVDYGLQGPPPVGGTGHDLGTQMNIPFTIENFGTDGDSSGFTWTAWLSDDASPSVDDVPVDTGTEISLASSGSIGLTVNGYWSVLGPKYVVVTITAAEDVNSVNDVFASSNAYTVNPAGPVANVDYIIDMLPNVTSPVQVGDPMNYTFTIRNNGPDNGTASVFWNAYLSADPVAGGDLEVASGMLGGPLNNGQVSVDQDINTGNWPSTPGSAYLIVTIDAADDFLSGNGGNNEFVSAEIFQILPNANYRIINVTVNTGLPANSYQPFTGDFEIRNDGPDDALATDFWSYDAYLSDDPIIDPTDTLFYSDSGMLPLNNGQNIILPFNGNWPDESKNFYVMMDITTGSTGIDQTIISPPYPVSNPVDYTITSFGLNGPTIYEEDELADGTFRISEVGIPSVTGQKPIAWEVYASTDGISAEDQLVDSGTVLSPPSGGGFVDVDFTGPWPFCGNVNFIVTITSADDSRSSNNLYLSPIYPIDEGNNDNGYVGPMPSKAWPPALADASNTNPDNISDVGIITVGEDIIINGVMDDMEAVDTYRVRLGNNVTKLWARAEWPNPPNDGIDLLLWDQTEANFTIGNNTAVDEEPSGGPTFYWTVNGNPGEYAYISVFFLKNALGDPYTLLLYADDS